MRALWVLLQATALVASLSLAGCISAQDQADQEATFNPVPEKEEDGHGWGVSVQQGGH